MRYFHIWCYVRATKYGNDAGDWATLLIHLSDGRGLWRDGKQFISGGKIKATQENDLIQGSASLRDTQQQHERAKMKGETTTH